jgi:hypothetical protein
MSMDWLKQYETSWNHGFPTQLEGFLYFPVSQSNEHMHYVQANVRPAVHLLVAQFCPMHSFII